MNILEESFVKEYFIFNAILSKNFDSEKIYSCLKKIFCLNQDVVLNYDILSEIENYEDYSRYLRIKEFNKLNNYPTKIDENESSIINLKGKALSICNGYNLSSRNDDSSSIVINNLMDHANNGTIIAIRVLGILLCEGIFTDKNTKKGLGYLYKGVQWGDIISILAYLYYCDKDRPQIFKMLNAAIVNTPFEFLNEIIKNHYNIVIDDKSEEILFLKQCFCNGMMKSDFYIPMYARIIYSQIISIKDKIKIFYSDNKEKISDVCDLPLKLKYKNISYNNDFEDFIIKKEKESKKIVGLLNNINNRKLYNYKPICIALDSNYLVERYNDEFRKVFNNDHVETIYVNDLDSNDLSYNKNNIIFRNINEDKNNIMILVFKGDISDEIIKFMISFLKTKKRSKFNLSYPSISLNLDCVLPICICDKENANILKEYVELVELGNIPEEDMLDVISYMFEEKKDIYNISYNKIDDSVINRLKNISIDEIDNTIESFLKSNINNSYNNITIDNISPYLNNINNSYGFGRCYL